MTLVWIVLGIFASWRLTWDITSCSIVHEEGMPDWCEPNSEGPFQLYDGIRWLFMQNSMPDWVHRGIQCPYCVSFWCAFFMTLFLPVYQDLNLLDAFRLWFLLGVSTAGVIAFGLRILHHYGIDAREF